MHYRICPNCGAHLDHGEHCDCKEIETAPVQRKRPLAKSTTASLPVTAPEVKLIERRQSGG